MRYSPLTFRLAEQIAQVVQVTRSVYPDVYAVMIDKGVYEEDPGR